MEFECPECGRIFATAGKCPEDYLELEPLKEEEKLQTPFYPQDKYKSYDEEDNLEEDHLYQDFGPEEDNLDRDYEDA